MSKPDNKNQDTHSGVHNASEEHRAAVRTALHSRRGDGTTSAMPVPQSSYQDSLFSSAGASDTPSWSDSTKGRILIRTLSRGVVGAAFFALGGRMAGEQLKGYHRDIGWAEIERSKPLQYIAKGWDSTLTRMIEGAVRGIAGLRHDNATASAIARSAVTFRDMKIPPLGAERNIVGRSYGAEAVAFTFDFAMMSVGDALVRNIVQAIDPNVKKKWKVNDEGGLAVKGENWHFKPLEFVKWTGQTAWRILSKNQGEDWAAAIPYAFQMKFQRQFLSNVMNKRWSGHKLVFDNGWNGGSYRVDQAGKIIGDYQFIGAMDLHARFVGYNWYTLMFREGYDNIANAYNRWKNDQPIFEQHTNKPNSNILTETRDGIGGAMRYVAKSFIKANLYMNPAVTFFWTIRAPQSKWRGLAVEQTNVDQGAKVHAISTESPYHGPMFGGDHYAGYTTGAFEKNFSRLLHPIGKFSNYVGTKAGRLSDHLEGWNLWPSANSYLGTVVGQGQERRKFMHEYTDAMLSYTPYIIAKAEFGLRVDDSKGVGKLGQMDTAIYKFMDDVGGFKFSELGKDIKTMWKLGTRFERELKPREGAEPDEKEMVKAPATPETTVHANTLMHQTPVNFRHQHKKASNDPVMNEHDERRWAQMVAGSDINPARIHSGGNTRH